MLDTIIARKKQEVASLPVITSVRREQSSFIDAILRKCPALIAEVKLRSPSKGHLLSREDIPKLLEVYDRHAQAISVLCDETFFGGGFDLLAEVRSLTDKPLLAKEFVLHRKQIDHALHNGANAILLIAAILDEQGLGDLTAYAANLGLDLLIEVHTCEELQTVASVFQALPSEIQQHILLGINNRDLRSLAVNIATTEKLAPLARKKLPSLQGIIAESGIVSREDIQRLAPCVQGFLIGTAILQAKDPEFYSSSLFPVP